jgi:hypothetical protein
VIGGAAGGGLSGTRPGQTPRGPGKAKEAEGNRRGADASGAMARGGVTRAGGRMEVPVARARPAEAPAGFVRLLPPAGRRPSTPPLGPASPAPCVPGRSGASVDVSSALYTLTRTYAGVSDLSAQRTLVHRCIYLTAMRTIWKNGLATADLLTAG